MIWPPRRRRCRRPASIASCCSGRRQSPDTKSRYATSQQLASSSRANALTRLRGNRCRGRRKLPQDLFDVGDVEGLLQLGAGMLREKLARARGERAAGHEHEALRQLRVITLDGCIHRSAIHVWHHQITEHEIELRIRLEPAE